MQFYFNMPQTLYPCYKEELEKATANLQQGYLQQCWLHYERAHILGQR